MGHQENNYEGPEEELGQVSSGLDIPCWLKWLATAFSIALIGFTLCYTYRYLGTPSELASPNELGLSSIFLFSISALVIVWIPWAKLGIRISRIGGIEFENIVKEQASEHAEEVSYLEDRIEVLEAKARSGNEMSEITDHLQEPKLRKLLIDFLTKYNQWAFSPSRIRAWGAKQQGFASFVEYNHSFIRSTLQKMVSENLLETRISKKGNTLYRIPLA